MAQRVAASQGRTNRRFLLIAVLLGGLAAALVYAKLSSDGGGGGGESASTTATQIVVAKSAIDQRTMVTAEMLELKSVPNNLVIAGAFTSVNDVVGKVTKFPLDANEQIVATGVGDLSAPQADALAQVVPTGKRGFSIGVSEVKSAGGLVLPGDYVDIVWVCCKDQVALARTVLQNVQVAAISQNIVDSGPAGGADDPVAADGVAPKPEAISMTLLVNDQQAHLLLMAENTGEMRAALRGVGDTTIEPPALDYTLATDLLPEEILAGIPRGLWPEGYKDEQ